MDSTTSTFKVNDFVWAKLARYPPWPAIVMRPDPLAPPTHKNSQWIYFFGSHDYAWVEEKYIKPFNAFKDRYKATYKRASIREAVEELEEIMENIARDPEYKIEFIKYTRKETKHSSNRSRKSNEGLVERKRSRSLKERNLPTPKKKSRPSSDDEMRKQSMLDGAESEILSRRSSLSDESESELDDLSINGDEETPESRSAALRRIYGFLAANIYDEGIIKNLINAGMRLIVWSSSSAMLEELQDYADRQEAYFEIRKTRREVLRDCQVLFNHQTDPDQVGVILEEFGLFDENDNLLKGKGYVEMTGIDPDTSLKHCKLILNKGGTYIETMVQGNRHEANRGELVVIAAGVVDLFRKCQTGFRALGKHTFLLPTIGTATKIHMILQAMRGIILGGLAEGFAIADKNGIILDVFKDLLDLTSMSSPYLKSKGELIIEEKFEETEEPIQVIQKSLSEIRQLSNMVRQPVPLASNANEIFKHARRLGFDNQDSACIYNRTRY